MPHMNRPRRGCGNFKTYDKKWLYVFGGATDTIERLDLNDESAIWENVDFDNHNDLTYQHGIIMYPLQIPYSEENELNSNFDKN